MRPSRFPQTRQSHPLSVWPKVRVRYYVFSAGFLVLTAAGLVVMICRRAV